MEGLKTAFFSKGMWGGFITIGLGIATYFGVAAPDCSPEVLAEFKTCQEFISSKIHGLVIGVAGLVAMIGRWLAKKKLTLF